MYTNTEQKILELLLPQPFESYSVRAISEKIRVDYSLVHRSVRALIKRNIIKARKIGKAISCQANLSSDPQQLAISSLIHQQGFLKKTNFGFVTDAIKEKLADCIYIMVLFGSHVKGKARKDSDVDILFVAQHPSDIEPMRIRIQSVLSSTNIPVEFELVTCKSLQDMFGKKNTIGNEILHTSIPLYGAEQYYTMVNGYDKKRGH